MRFTSRVLVESVLIITLVFLTLNLMKNTFYISDRSGIAFGYVGGCG